MKVLSRERGGIQAATVFILSLSAPGIFLLVSKSETPKDMLLKPFRYQKFDIIELLGRRLGFF